MASAHDRDLYLLAEKLVFCKLRSRENRMRTLVIYLYLMGVHLMGGCLMGVYLTGVCLLGVYLTGVHLMP